MAFNNEIEEVKAQIKVLEKKLEELSQTKSPAEEAYKRVYAEYPMGEPFWVVFKNGYEQAQEDYKVGEYQETAQKRGERVHKDVERCVRESVKWCEEHPDTDPLDWLKPQTPEQVADGLKEAFREAVKQGVVSSTKSPTLYDVIAQWYLDSVTDNIDLDVPTCINILLDEISLWLPKPQSAAGSQNAYVESAVEGFNDAINKIREKLR